MALQAHYASVQETAFRQLQEAALKKVRHGPEEKVGMQRVTDMLSGP
jgi:hypothetical protein